MSKKKKGTRESSPPTNVSSPIRGANQDQSGYGVSHNTADYTISDETQYDEGFVAGVGAVRATPLQMNSTPRGRKERNAPRSASGLQRAADKRRMQLDRVAQKRAAMQKKTKEKLIAKRQHNEELSLTNLAKKVGAESKAKMPKDKVTQSFKKFSDFVKEETQLDEISKKTLGSYIGKATKDLSASKFRVGFEHGKEVGQGKWSASNPKDVEKDAGPEEKIERNVARKREKGLAMAGRKIAKEEVEYMEEGRPKKNATSEDPGSEHIVMQLRKAISMRGQHPVKFVNGKSSLVSPATAHRLLNMHDNMKTSAEKDEFAKHIHKSVDHMRDALAGKMPAPEKKTISLGGSHGDHRR